MNNKTWVVVIAIIIILAGVWYYQTQVSGLVTGETIKIGAILGLSGNYQDVGQRIKEGLDLALEDSKSEGLDFQIIYEDSKSDPKTALAAYQKLINLDRVNLLIVAHSNVASALAPLAEKDQKVLFAIYAVAPGIPESGGFIFRNDLKIDREMKFLAEAIHQEGISSVGVLSVNTEGSIGSTNEFIKYFELLGGKIVANEKYGKDESDHRAYLTKIKAKKPEAIFSVSSPKQLGVLIKQARDLGMDQKIFGDWHSEGEELLKVAGGLADGLVYTHTFDQSSDEKLIKDFVTRYEFKYHQMADYRSALAYDTLKIIARASDRCATFSSVCVKDELSRITNYRGVTGLTTIDQNGDTDKRVILKTVKEGQFIRLEN